MSKNVNNDVTKDPPIEELKAVKNLSSVLFVTINV